jgi:hypothetical protein
MTSSKIIGGAASPIRIVNVDTTPEMLSRPVGGGAAQPVYVVNFDLQSGCNPEFDTLQVGDITGGNYAEIEADGTIVFYGNATCWRDELQSVTSARLTSPAGDFVLNDPEGSITSKISSRYPTDYVSMNLQINHDWALGTTIHPHLHWWQTTANVPNWMIGYRWQKQGSAKTTAWTHQKWSSNSFTWTAGTLNQITELATIAAPAGYGEVSDIVQIRLYRDYTNVSLLFGAGDPVNASQDFVNLDVHIQVDTLGSHLEYSK